MYEIGRAKPEQLERVCVTCSQTRYEMTLLSALWS